MKKLLTYFCATLCAGSLFAESVWVATIEVDSIQSLQTGIEAFCRASDIPLPPGGISKLTSDTLKEVLPLPSLDTAVSFKDPIRVFVLENASEPLNTGGAPVLLFALTLPAEAKALQDQLAQVYGGRRDAGNIITFSAPPNPQLPANLLLSVSEGNKALLATSEAAFTWFKQQQKLENFLPIAGSQALRACVNMKRLMEALPDGQPNPLAPMLGDLDYFSVAVAPNAQALTLSYGMRAKAGSLLASLIDASLKQPDAALWNGLPANALFAFIGQEPKAEDMQKLMKAYFQQDTPLDPIRVKLEQTLTGDLIRYLVPTKDQKGIRLVDVNPMKDSAAAKEILKTLGQSELSPGVKLQKEGTREAGGLTIERYSLVFDVNAIMQDAMQRAGEDMPVPDMGAMTGMGTVFSLFAKNIVFEFTVKDNYLISAVSPMGATDDWVPALPFAAPAVTLDKKIAALDPTATPLLGAYELRLMPLLKQIVSMLPNVKPEHVNLFAAATDPVQVWMSRTADNTTVATVRVPTSEVAAIVKLTQQGTAVFQELFFSVIAGQMQQLMMQPVPPAAIPPPNF